MILVSFSGFSKFSMMLQKPFMIRSYVVIFFLRLSCPRCVQRTGNLRYEWAHRGRKHGQGLHGEVRLEERARSGLGQPGRRAG